MVYALTQHGIFRPVDPIGPVSYTHLDVYKRQGEDAVDDLNRNIKVCDTSSIL